MNAFDNSHVEWPENVIIADADYLDRVAFHLSVNFERMLGRRIPKADLASWAVCAALDGGLRPGDHKTQLVLIHAKERQQMDNFSPAAFATELSGQAFRDEQLGEFSIDSYPVEPLVEKDDFLLDVARLVCDARQVRRVMLIPDAEEGDLYDRLRHMLSQVDDEQKRVTLFAMQPMAGGNYRQELLGYSIMQALGIRGDELK